MISSDFNIPNRERLVTKVYSVLEQHSCGKPHYPLTGTEYHCEVQFVLDDYDEPINAKSIWIRFSTAEYITAKNIAEVEESVNVVRDLKEVLEQHFNVPVIFMSSAAWAIVPL